MKLKEIVASVIHYDKHEDINEITDKQIIDTILYLIWLMGPSERLQSVKKKLDSIDCC